MKLIKLIKARQAIVEVLSTHEDVNTALMYWMTKFVYKTEKEQDFYSTETEKIINKFAEKKDDETVIVPADRIDEFKLEIQELENVEVEVPDIKFKLSDIATCFKFSTKQMYSLIDFINDEK